MQHVGLLCPILLVTVLLRPTVLAHVQNNYQTRLDRASIVGYEHIHGPQYVLLGQQTTGASKSSLLASLGDRQHPASQSNLNTYSLGDRQYPASQSDLYTYSLGDRQHPASQPNLNTYSLGDRQHPASQSNLNTHNVHNIAPMQDSRLGRLHRLNLGTGFSHGRAEAAVDTRHAYLYMNRASLSSDKQSPSAAQHVVVQFAQDPSVGITDSSRLQGCVLCAESASGAEEVEVAHTGSPPRMKRRETRATENVWGDDLDSVLSKLGRSSDRITYNNINTWLSQLTGSHPRLVQLSRDMYDAQGPSWPKDAGYKVKAAPLASRSGQDRESQPNIRDSPDDTEQGFPRPPAPGSYDYDVLYDMSADVNKRGKPYKANIYALIKQGPRHAQAVPLQDLPRTSSSLRTYDKLDRSQPKEQKLRPPMSSPKGAVCEAESDGVMPMRCPSSPDTCLYDSMICDGKPDCPQAEDESFPLCVLRHWTFRWFRKFHPATQRQASP